MKPGQITISKEMTRRDKQLFTYPDFSVWGDADFLRWHTRRSLVNALE